MELSPKTVQSLRRRLFGEPRLRRPLDYLPDMSGHRFLFIGGLHRSGTSTLHRLLREHPDASGFKDTGAIEDEGQHLQDVFPPGKKFGGPGRFAFEPAASLDDEDALRSEQSRQRLLREWGAYYDLTRPVLLEKSPPNLIRADYFRSLFPGCRFIFIVRHPICVALATRKWSKTSVLELLLHWVIAHRRMASQCGDDTIVLRYEDFIAAPEYFLDRVLDHAGLTPFHPTEQVLDHNSRYFDQWREEFQMDAALVRLSAPDLGRWLEFCGYDMEPPFVAARPNGPIPWVQPPR